jgi:hypothetical protein
MFKEKCVTPSEQRVDFKLDKLYKQKRRQKASLTVLNNTTY